MEMLSDQWKWRIRWLTLNYTWLWASLPSSKTPGPSESRKNEYIYSEMYIRLVMDYVAILLPLGFTLPPPPILLALGLTLNPPPPTLRFLAPIWSLGYGTWVVSFLFIEPSTSVPLQLVYVIRKKFLGKWNKFRWLRKKNVSFCNMLFTSTINVYQNNKHWMLSLTLIKPVWALPFPFQWVVPSSMVQLFLSWINNYSLKMQQQRISPSIAE